MADGDAGAALGWQVVPDNGGGDTNSAGRVRWGAREINKTRDYAAAAYNRVPASKTAFRTAAGITSGTGPPPTTGAADGDIYFKIIG